MDLSLSNFFTVSVSAAGAGAGYFNTSNIALFTNENYNPSFGDLNYNIYLDPADVVADFGSSSVTAQMAAAIFAQSPNILANGGYLVVIPFLDDAESLTAAVTRMTGVVQFFGLAATQVVTQGDMLTAAALVQGAIQMAFFVTLTQADVAPGGNFDQLRTGGFDQSRGLFYDNDGTETSALVFMAGYMGRLLCVNFAGSNTTLTMQGKSLATIQPDSSMTQSLALQCKAAGVDCYPSFGTPTGSIGKLFTSGLNTFVDRVYNRLWLVGQLLIDGFNVIAETDTKVPQTEEGVNQFTTVFTQDCEQAVTNGFLAPGAWTSGSTFGNLADFLRNITERGYYIYTQPVAQQSAVTRAARTLPLAQIAVKEAGAVHQGNILISINP